MGRKRKSGSECPQLDLAALFSPPGRPVFLELCSGGGEWIVAQAQRFSSASWVANELRCDRAGRCFQRFALAGLGGETGNAEVIAGDAKEALERRLEQASCDLLFINHPEPPHKGGGSGTSLEVAAASAETEDGSD